MAKEASNEIYKKPLWKYYKGVEYIEIDFTIYTSEDLMIRYYTEACEMILQKPDKTVRVFTNATGVKPSLSTIRSAREIGKKAQRGVKRSVMIGTVGLTTMMLKFYSRYTGSPVKPFSREEAAMEYLIRD